MADVRIALAPPNDANIVALRIYEAVDKNGPFTQVERTTDIGAYPAYATSYLTTHATSALDWFYVGWEDDAGNIPYTSSPTIAASASIVEQVAERAIQRDASVDITIATQEAEAAVEEYYGADPYSVTQQPTYRVLNGLVCLTLARCYIFQGALESESVSIGLVRLQQSAGASKNIDGLIELANKALGMNTSVVLQMRRQHHNHRYEVTVP